jgi:hypothetical protein
VVNKGLLVCSSITISNSLALSQDSNHVCGCCIMMCALIVSLRPLMKHDLKNKLDWLFVYISNCSKEVIYSITMYVWHNFVKHPIW